jgi:tRNA1(Val) A37 N6-methylase TrmN6
MDLSERTCMGLRESSDFLKSIGCPMQVEINHMDCISGLDSISESFDFVLTSPPFLDVEEYAGVTPLHNYHQWVAVFLGPMIKNISEKLKPGGKMAVYIEKAGVHDIPKKFIELAVDAGLSRQKSVFFKMNYGASRRTTAGKGIEILVFEKTSRP